MVSQDKPIFAISRTDPNYEPADAFGERLYWWRVTSASFARTEQGWHMIVATALLLTLALALWAALLFALRSMHKGSLNMTLRKRMDRVKDSRVEVLLTLSVRILVAMATRCTGEERTLASKKTFENL